MTKKRPTTVQEYIDGAPPEARPHLRTMYRILKSVAPERTEAIKWGVPVFWDRKMLFGFAAYKAHLSFGPAQAAIKRFSGELAEYGTGKGTIRFPYDRPIPEELVREIASYCLAAAKE